MLFLVDVSSAVPALESSRRTTRIPEPFCVSTWVCTTRLLDFSAALMSVPFAHVASHTATRLNEDALHRIINEHVLLRPVHVNNPQGMLRA